MRHEWPAIYLDGQTATRHPATVRLMGLGLEVAAAGGVAQLWPYGEIRVTQGFYPGQEVRLERGGELAEALVIADQDFLTSLHSAAPGLASQLHEPSGRRSRLRLVVLGAVGVVAVAGALYLWGIPALAPILAARVPVAWEDRLGRAAIDQLAPPELRCVDPGRQRALDAIVARLAATDPDAPYPFRVIVTNRPFVNALAAPGGYIVVFQGLLDQTDGPEELAGVLAHEMQHVLRRHATQALIQHVSIGLLLAALTGDVTGPIPYGAQSARVLGQLQYSRRAEAEADAGGMRMLHAARIDPAGMLRFFEGLAKDRSQPRSVLRYLSTHPSPADRIERLTALARQAHGAPVMLLPGVNWDDVKRICAASARDAAGR